MHLNIRHRRVANHGDGTNPRNANRFMPNFHKKNEAIVVEDLSERLIPIIGKVKFATVIHHLFTPQECRALIDMTEKRGYMDAMVHGPNGNEVLRKDIRNSGRCIVDDESLAQVWFDRVIHALEGSPVKDKLLDGNWITSHEDRGKHHCNGLRAVGLNERLRFLRYHSGQYFGSHRDNAFIRDGGFGAKAGEESHLTFLLYLNDKMEGGQTRFENDGRFLDVVPEVGSVLMFDHDILHEAIKIESGIKYCCRTDVMFAADDSA